MVRGLWEQFTAEQSVGTGKKNRHRDESSNILSLCLFFCDLSGNPVKFCQTVFVEFTGIPAYNDR